MNELRTIVTSDAAIIFGEILVILLLIAVFVLRNKKKKQELKILEIQQEQKRMERLDRLLMNPDGAGRGMQKEKQNRPYEVKYIDSGQISKTSKNGIKLQISVRAELSVRKYLIEVEDQIMIGRNEENDLQIDNRTVSGRHCMILRQGEDLYVRDLQSSNYTIIQRNQAQRRVTEVPVKLNHQDELVLGDVVLEIAML